MKVNYKRKDPIKRSAVSYIRAPTVSTHMMEMEQSYEFINGMNHIIYLGFRDGTIVCLHPTTGAGYTGELTVRKSIQIGGDNKIIANSGSYEDNAASQLSDAYSSMKRITETGNHFASIDYVVNQAYLEKQGGTCYYHELDIVASINSQEDVMHHPESANHVYDDMVTKEPMNRHASATVDILIIDNTGETENKYVNLAGMVHVIKPVVDISIENGVYITRSKMVQGVNFNEMAPTIVKTSLEDHKHNDLRIEPPIFDSFKDAEDFGNLTKLRKKTKKKLEKEYKKKERAMKNNELALKNKKIKLEKECSELKAKHDREMANYKRERLEMEKRVEELEYEHKMKSIRAKDDYEAKHYRRKDNSEIIKYVPAIVTGAVGIAALIGKFR